MPPSDDDEENTAPVSHAARPWVTLKYGGTSVSFEKTWRSIANRIKELLPKYRVVLVLSALSQVTNRLEMCLQEAVKQEELVSLAWIEERHRQLAKEAGLPLTALKGVFEKLAELGEILQGVRLIREVSPRLKARVCAFGEQMSTVMAVQILKDMEVKASLVPAMELLLSVQVPHATEEDRYLNASVLPVKDPERAEHIVDRHGRQDVVVTQGFVCRNHRNESCLLGRGGSDTSGSLMAAFFAAHHLEIWTDVYGMFSGDPRKMPHARLILRISSREAQELATSGAKVLHPRCIAPAALAGIPIEIRNTMDPGSEYTLITVDDYCDAGALPTLGEDGALSPHASAGSSSRGSSTQGCILLSLTTMEMWGTYGFLGKCFAPFEEFGLSVDHVATSQTGVSVTLSYVPGGPEGDAFQGLLKAIGEMGTGLLKALGEMGTVEWQAHCSVVTVVGNRLSQRLPDIGRAMQKLQDVEVLMVSASSEDVAMSFIVREKAAQALVEVFHHQLIPVTGGDAMFGSTFRQLTEEDGSERHLSLDLREAELAALDALAALHTSCNGPN
ncbi:Aspartate/glutamate/uridylate kinase [Baffinella frigidus]|nr:Aspartate/glutamate/uridylate kinase [Cryptophyta sp. CCMP2293]